MAEETVKTEKKKNSWFKQLRAEFKKVVWPDKKTIGKQTVAVIVIAVIICIIITLVDTGALALVELIIK